MADVTCEICGQPIDGERLLVLPESYLCMEHAVMMKKYGGEFIVGSAPTMVGKGIKTLQGGVDAVQIPNVEGMRKLRKECGLSTEDESDDEQS